MDAMCRREEFNDIALNVSDCRRSTRETRAPFYFSISFYRAGVVGTPVTRLSWLKCVVFQVDSARFATVLKQQRGTALKKHGDDAFKRHGDCHRTLYSHRHFYLLDSVEVSIDNKRGPHGKECVILILHQNLEGHLSLCPHQL